MTNILIFFLKKFKISTSIPILQTFAKQKASTEMYEEKEKATTNKDVFHLTNSVSKSYHEQQFFSHNVCEEFVNENLCLF